MRIDQTIFQEALEQFLQDGFCYLPNDDHPIFFADTLRDLGEDFVVWPADRQKRVRFDRGPHKYCSHADDECIHILKVGTLERVMSFPRFSMMAVDKRSRTSPLFNTEDEFVEWYNEQIQDVKQSINRFFILLGLDVVDDHYLQAKYLIHVSNA